MSLDWLAGIGAPLRGSVRAPGDKSISHRALILAAIAEGKSRLNGFLEGEDTRATARILSQLGVSIDTPEAGQRVVYGVGLHGLTGSRQVLDCGNAGTGMRLLAGLLSGQKFESTLVGDASLSARPMARVIKPLTAMGAWIEAVEGGFPPLRIHINSDLQAIEYKAEVASAQVKSAILLAGLYARGTTVVNEPQPTRDYTESMLQAFGWPIEFSPGFASLTGGHGLTATDVEIPADFSSAAFFVVAASIIPGSELRLLRVGMNPRRTGLLEALRLMGADIVEENRSQQGGEETADLCVRHAPLKGIRLPVALVPDMIDEFPAFFVAAAVADGTTVLDGLRELRVKESDRLATMATALAALGADVEEHPDGAIIQGGPLHGGEVESLGDHRIAMAMAIAGQLASSPVRIADCANVGTSFPGFAELAGGCGFNLRVFDSENPASVSG